MFDGLGAVADLRVTLSDADGFPQSFNATQVTPNTFELLGQSPILGRNFQASDAMPGAPMVMILTIVSGSDGLVEIQQRLGNRYS